MINSYTVVYMCECENELYLETLKWRMYVKESRFVDE